MNVLLIPSFNVIGGRLQPYVPYGLLSLQASARTFANAMVSVADLPARMLETKYTRSDEIAEHFAAEFDLDGFDLYAISTISDSAHYSLDLARIIKSRRPSSLVALGGPYVTKLSDLVLKAFDYVDAVFIGESELSFAALLRKSSPSEDILEGIAGIRTRTVNFTPGEIVGNLDLLPYISDAAQYFSFVKSVKQFQGNEFAVPLEATRGCPLQCSS